MASKTRGGKKRAGRTRPGRARAGRARAGRAASAGGGEFDVAEVKGRLRTTAAVPYLARVRRIERRKSIHGRRLVPRVPTGTWRADPNPTGALALDRPVTGERRDAMAGAPMAATDAITL